MLKNKLVLPQLTGKDGEIIRAFLDGYERGKADAQSEHIIHCKDCKYGILDCDFPHERYCDFKGNEWNNDNHFCGHAKRKERGER